MASIKRYYNKSTGELVSAQLRVYRGTGENGKDLKPYLKQIKIPDGYSEQRAEKFLQKEAVLFEEQCHSGQGDYSKVLFRDFAPMVMDIKRIGGKEESTLSHYQDMLNNRLLPYFGHMKVRNINGMVLNRFYKEMLEPGQNQRTGGCLSPKTVLELHRLMSTILAEAKKQHIIADNPAEDATPPKATKKLPNYYQEEDYGKILRAFDNEPPKWKTLGHLFATYGDRRSEFVGIKRENIDFQKHQILLSTCVLYNPRKGIYAKEYPKNGKVRFLPLTEEIEQVLMEYLDWLDREQENWGDLWIPTDFIFTGEHGGMMNPDVCTQHFIRMTRKYRKADPGFPKINPHAFRHTVVSMLLNRGLDLITVADYVGDDPETIAKHYAHLMNAGKIRAANTMGEIISEKRKTPQRPQGWLNER